MATEAQLPSPPQSPSPPTDSPQLPETSNTDLLTHLDELLAHYLIILDIYTSLRDRLSIEFKAGFLSLAHANRNASSTLGAGRRYGPEEFDGRMKATRGGKIEVGTFSTATQAHGREVERGVQEADSEPVPTTTVREEDAASRTPLADAETKIISPPLPSTQSSTETSTDPSTLLEIDPLPEPLKYSHYTTLPLHSCSPPPKDPLKWFGIFTPPPLRQCQSSFTSSVSSTIPELISTTSQMRVLEEEIWRTRAELGMLEGYDVPEEYSYLLSEGQKEKQGDVMPGLTKQKSEGYPQSKKEKATSPKSKTQKLVSSSKMSEPRSRVLKME